MNKMNNLKKCLLTVLCALFAVCMTFAICSNGYVVKANEQATPFFRMTEGASIKLTSDGIRFMVEMDETHANDVKDAQKNLDLYFIIAPESIFNAVQDTNEDGVKDYYNLVKENKCYFIPVDENKIYSVDGVYYANGCIYEVKDANRAIEFCAVAVILDNTDAQNPTVYEYAQLEENVDYARSLYNTLNVSMQKLVGELNVIEPIMEVYGSWLGSEKYPLEIKNADQYDDLVEYVNASDISDKIYVNVYNALTSSVKFSSTEKVAITNLISTPADFSTFMQNIKGKLTDYANQTVLLTNSINMSGYTGLGGSEYFSGNTTGAIFRGILDGNGYAVNNFKFNFCVFKCIEGATIKNIALKLVLNPGQWCRGFINEINSGTLDNVYLKIDNTGNGSNDFTLAYRVNNGVIKIKNTVIDRASAGVKKLIDNKDDNATISFENSFVIGNITSIGVSGEKVTGNPIGKSAIDVLNAVVAGGEQAGWNTDLWNVEKDGLSKTLTFGEDKIVLATANVISTAEEFSNFLLNVKGGKDYSGTTIMLSNDIDMSSYDGVGGTSNYDGRGKDTNGNSITAYFRGTIDGNGYTIKNLKVIWCLFQTVENCTIKNLALHLIPGDNWWRGLAVSVNSLTLDNFYFDGTTTGQARGNDAVIGQTLNTSLIVKNSILNRKGTTGDSNRSICDGGNSGSKATFTNAFVIGNTSGIIGTNNGVTITGSPIMTPANALSAITTAGLTAENGWNTNFWKIVDGNLVCGRQSVNTVIANA